jgi:succinate dehydrogenase / fumarate reductase cytochrome b subunit
MASAKPSAGSPRPVSPHLQIYSPLINMMMSIVHRITGVALYGGTLLLGGVRHMIWDTGRGFDLATVDQLCWGSLIGSITLTILVWAVAILA